MKVKKGDQVKIISGKDRGKTGKVVKVIIEDNRLVIEGLNLVKKNVRPRRTGEKGQIVEVPRPLDASKVMIVCTQCGKSARTGHVEKGGKKYRFCKRCHGEI